MEFAVTVGERHDSVPALDLLSRCGPRQVLADKAYDSQALRDALEANDCVATIPTRKGKKHRPYYDKDMYKERHAVECTFGLFKQARRFATRYEKTLRNYAAVVLLSCIKAWLRI